MSIRGELQKKAELIDRIVKRVGERLPGDKAELVGPFVRTFYAHVPPADMLDQREEDLYGAAVTLWNFARERKPGTAKIRAYNPRFDVDGWQSVHTVVEIVNDDMPFLVDSVTSLLNQLGQTVHLVTHPIVHARRSAAGRLAGYAERGAKDAVAESVMQLQVSEQSSPEALREMERQIAGVLRDVRHAVEDWRTMRARALEVVKGIEKAPPKGVPADDVREVCDFLRWIEDNHFTFLGYREYNYVGAGRKAVMEVVDASGLGILRDADVQVFDGLRNLGELPPDIRSFIEQPTLLMITKANRRSTIHRPVHLDVIVVKKIDKAGRVVGEHRFAGLFTSVAYNQSPKEIPLLRKRIEGLLSRAGFAPASHDGKALVNILETYPRDELFQASEDELFETAIGILHLQERQRTALFIRRDPFERFISCLVFLPRDRFNTDLRLRVQEILEKAFNGSVTAFYTQIAESVLGRIHFIIKTTRGEVPDIDIRDLEARLVEASRSWSDRMLEALVEAKGEEQGLALLRRYGEAFPTAYREAHNAPAAIGDIERIEVLDPAVNLALNLFRPIEAGEEEVHLKVYHGGNPVPLSDVLPMLENMGLKVIAEVPYEVAVGEGRPAIWIHDFTMQVRGGARVDLGAVKAGFQEALTAVWTGQAEDDGFNRLVLLAGLGWREIAVLRAYARYLKQAAFTYSPEYIQDTLAKYPDIARMIVQLFRALFDPTLADRETKAKGVAVEIDHALDAVVNLDEDKIVRRLLNLVQATLRTNYFQPAADRRPKSYLSFKLDSRAIDELPLPRPLVEIWVYSPRVEAVHLRGGKVARGGIRWSDRREDFRTEILSLMKAQMVKNAVIVPVGSKGGFVVKRPPADPSREAQQAEGIECYKILMRGMLDITDNLKAGAVVPPADVVRRDGDDPYLVVAADKGTATFSDIANGVSLDYGFWLGDAFASGGSAGYDHKKMGITARGAWEAVKRHFREIGIDIQSTDFTAVGVGDMSGDVFGNGMLLSRHTRLLAAFDHRHVFIDPSPDPAKGWAERKRLFDLPRSSWADYDAKLISAGGGVFDRKAKSIKISPEMKAAFAIRHDSLTPNELMQALLRAPVDLLWFGGIGTYVKASTESNAEVGDRANDAIRVNGREIQAKVLGEGANLGCTQRGRVEYALKGGRINTDAIDNSAGVDTSDHEVNIKILLGQVVEAGDMTLKQRDKLLGEMTDEVGRLVLKDNYDQTLTLSISQSLGTRLIDGHLRLMRDLERSSLKLDRGIEFLPDDETLMSRASLGLSLTRPESAVLLAYAKMWLYDQLLPSELPDDPQLVADLEAYFPERLRKPYRAEIAQHRLRREIIATCLTNDLINHAGATFVDSMADKTQLSAPDIARAYAIVRNAFELSRLWAAVNALDNKVSAATQVRMLVEVGKLTWRASLWLLRNGRHPLDIAQTVGEFAPAVAELRGCLPEVLSVNDRAAFDRRQQGFAKDGVPAELAAEVAGLDVLGAALDIARTAAAARASIPSVARVYFAVGARFGLDWLRSSAEALAIENSWQKMAVAALVDDFLSHQKQLTHHVLNGSGVHKANGDGAAAVEAWAGEHKLAIERADRLVADLKGAGSVDIAMLAVANGQMRALVDG